MCIVKVKPEIEEDVIVPARHVTPPPPVIIEQPPPQIIEQPGTTIITAPQPPAAYIEHNGHFDRVSPRSSYISTGRRRYYADNSPRGSYRHIDPRASYDGRVSRVRHELEQADEHLDRARHYAEDGGYGRRRGDRGNVVYVNPRHSGSSFGGRDRYEERVVVVNDRGHRRQYRHGGYYHH